MKMQVEIWNHKILNSSQVATLRIKNRHLTITVTTKILNDSSTLREKVELVRNFDLRNEWSDFAFALLNGVVAQCPGLSIRPTSEAMKVHMVVLEERREFCITRTQAARLADELQQLFTSDQRGLICQGNLVALSPHISTDPAFEVVVQLKRGGALKGVDASDRERDYGSIEEAAVQLDHLVAKKGYSRIDRLIYNKS